jgi:hypothetical protein
VKSGADVTLQAINTTLKAKSAISSLAAIQVLGDPAVGSISLESGSAITAVRSILLEAATINRAAAALVKAKTVTINDL